MTRFLYDTVVFVYAFGGEHQYREPCREIVAMAGRSELRGEASVDLLQEFMHQRLRRTGDRRLAASQARQVATLCALHEVRSEDLGRAIDLFERSPSLNARDAVFVALMRDREIPAILSPDRDFDDVEGLTRVDPADRDAVRALAL